MMKSFPTASRSRVTISTGSRIRLAQLPPQASVRRLVRVTRNWLMKYPSEPMTSTPSYPASRASTPQRTKLRSCRSTPRAESSRGMNGVMGDLTREGATESGE